jgi:hypothetical protein
VLQNAKLHTLQNRGQHANTRSLARLAAPSTNLKVRQGCCRPRMSRAGASFWLPQVAKLCTMEGMTRSGKLADRLFSVLLVRARVEIPSGRRWAWICCSKANSKTPARWLICRGSAQKFCWRMALFGKWREAVRFRMGSHGRFQQGGVELIQRAVGRLGVHPLACLVYSCACLHACMRG